MEGVCREVGVHHQQLLGRRPGVCRLHSLLGAIHCKIIRFLCQVYIIVKSTIEMISYYPMLNIGHCVYSLINSMKNIFYTDLLLLFSIVGKV